MRTPYLHSIYDDPSAPLAVVLGTNEIASAVAVHLTLAGYPVVLSHDPFPPVMRRAMAFHDALFGEPAVVEGVTGRRADTSWDAVALLQEPRTVAVTPLHLTDLLVLPAPLILIDGRMQKHRLTPDYRRIARLTVGLGPNFAVGANCDIAVETRPAKSGALLRRGVTDSADGLARPLGGARGERFVYSNRPGMWTTQLAIGTPVAQGNIVGFLDGSAVRAPLDGVLRGVVRDGSLVPPAVKLLEIDVRGAEARWTGIDDRGRTIAEATLAAIRLHADRFARMDEASGA